MRVEVTGVAQVSIMHESEYIEKAGEQFLGKSEFQVKELLQQTFEGHLRAIIGTMSVENSSNIIVFYRNCIEIV